MWSFEKINRCMAHLFLGQLVSTFDEEFRILFAQSEPLIIESALPLMEDFGLPQRRQYLSEKPSLYKDSRKFLAPEVAHSEDWGRHSYDERLDVDWRLVPKRKEFFRTPVDMYSRSPSQQLRIEPPFEQSSRMESPALKHLSYAEGGPGRYSFLSQPVVPEPENQERPFHRHPYLGQGKESEYIAYEKFCNQDYQLADQYPDSTLAQEMDPPDNFDPVLNYLSSARNVTFDQGSDNMPAAGVDKPFSSPYPKKLTSGQPNACQNSPTPSIPAEQKPFCHEHNPDRKDPSVKRGLRNWRISSYLSAYDSKGDDGLPLEPSNASDPFEDPATLVPPVTSRIDISTPKIPNVREFKVPAAPRASQIPGYAKNTPREPPKKLLDEPSSSAMEETKATPSPSESSTTEGERAEEAEVKEHASSRLFREDSFRRKYNAAIPRCSRLRSSLIFSSLEQQQTQDGKSTPGQNDEESDKTEGEATKQFFVSHVLGQRKTTVKKPFEWSSYTNKASNFDNSAKDSSKLDHEMSEARGQAPSKEESTEAPSAKNEESFKGPAMQQIEQTKSSPSVPRSKPVNPEMADEPTKPTKSLLGTSSNVDMNDPDARLQFFKELAAERKAAKAAEAEKSKTVQVGTQPTAESIAPVKKKTFRPEELMEKHTASIIATETEEDKKVIEMVSVEQGMEQNNSSGKQDDLTIEEITEEAASAVTAEDKISSEEESAKRPTKQDSGSKETADEMAATRVSNRAPTEESKEKVFVKYPVEKHDLSAKQEKFGPNESTEKTREAVTPFDPTKEEKRKEISLNTQSTDQKNTLSPILNETMENKADIALFTKTLKDKESKETIAVKPQKGESNIWIKNQESTPKETTDKGAATAKSSNIEEEKKWNVSLMQPEELKSNARSEKGEPGPEEKIEETAAPTMDTEEGREVCTKPPAKLQNLPFMTQEASGPVEQADKMAATGGAASGAEAEKHKEKVPSKQPVQHKGGGVNEDNEEDIAEKLDLSPTRTERTEEKVGMKQPTELMNYSSVKKEEQDPKGKAESMSVEKASEQNEETVSSPAGQFLETSNQSKAEDSLLKIDPRANNITEVEQSQGLTDSGMINTENNPFARTLIVSAEPVSPPSLPPEKLGSEIASARSAPRSSSDPADPDSQIYPGRSPVISNLHCIPTETLSISTIFPGNKIHSCESLNSEHSVDFSLQADDEKCTSQTEPEAARACQDPASVLTFPQSSSADDSAQVQSQICLRGFGADSQTNAATPESPVNAESVQSRDPAILRESLSTSENGFLQHITEERSKSLAVSVGGRAEGTPPSLNPTTAVQNRIPGTSPSTAKPKFEDFPEDVQYKVVPDSATNASQSDITASSAQGLPLPAPFSSQTNLTGPVSPSQYETECRLSLSSESAEPVLSPEAKETAPESRSPSHIASLPDQVSADLKTSPVLPSPDLCSPTEPTSKVPPVSALPSKIPEAVISGNKSSQPQEPQENSKQGSETEISPDPEMPETVEEKNETTDTTNNASITNGQVRKSNCSEPEEVTPTEVIPPPPQSKLPKSGQSRYHSSTANVISSSNLRDDTKLLLGQISASSQSRNEASKDAPVTDDEKEDEADKNAKGKERGFRSFSRGQPKSNLERDKVLERIQSMRKERKVYSRFEL